MLINDKYLIINIREYLTSNDDDIGELALIRLFSDFSCPKNQDVEDFLKRSSIIFAKKNQSVTYLVFSNDTKELVGYFCIALKSLTIKSEAINSITKKKLLRICELDEKLQTFTVPAYLIAQLGKNFNKDLENQISGNELLNLAWSIIKDMQYMCGGVIAFLETTNNEKLLKFYNDNGFKKFNIRRTKSPNTKTNELIQLLKTL